MDACPSGCTSSSLNWRLPIFSGVGYYSRDRWTVAPIPTASCPGADAELVGLSIAFHEPVNVCVNTSEACLESPVDRDRLDR